MGSYGFPPPIFLVCDTNKMQRTTKRKSHTQLPNQHKRDCNKRRCSTAGCTGIAENRTSYCENHRDKDLNTFEELRVHIPEVIVNNVVMSYLQPQCQGDVFLLKEYMNTIRGSCRIRSVEVDSTALAVPDISFPSNKCPFEVIHKWMQYNELYAIKLKLQLGTHLDYLEKVENTTPPFHFDAVA
jgi:hypothetical protein